MTQFLFSHLPFWAKRFGVAPVLPMSRDEMDALGWDSCDVILVTGDAYVDHPSFGMALIGRLLESQGFRVGIISQPDWRSVDDFMALGRPNLFFGITSGNMDSMVNRYTADRKIRTDDAYTPNAEPHHRPDRAVLVYAQRCREAYGDIPIILGGIEASLRRMAHYDYWSDQVRRSILLDAKADLLVYGNAERAIVEVAHRLAKRETIETITDLRGTAFIKCHRGDPGLLRHPRECGDPDPFCHPRECGDPETIDNLDSRLRGNDVALDSLRGNDVALDSLRGNDVVLDSLRGNDVVLDSLRGNDGEDLANDDLSSAEKNDVIRLPSYEEVKQDRVLYAKASRLSYLETNPYCARSLVQRHGDRDVWINPPPLPLSTEELDRVYELPYSRKPHLSYADARIPAYEMIRFSVCIMRGCFGGCSFCSITCHEGRVIQSRSQSSVLNEIEAVRNLTPGFTGVISDLGGPTANMYQSKCLDATCESKCRRFSCLYPKICKFRSTDHTPLIQLYRAARKLPGIKKVLIGSGVRYDLANESPKYIQELVEHHVGGYLKVAPEHISEGTLSKMMKPSIEIYERFQVLFNRYSQAAGKTQYLIPYFIAAHPGTTDEDMLELALWLKRHDLRVSQVQTFMPTPITLATTMYYSGINPLKPITDQGESVTVPKEARVRRLHKAFLLYHLPKNWPLIRAALRKMGRMDLIGNGKRYLVPRETSNRPSIPLSRG